MANVPNIPSVVVQIEDKSYLQPILSSGRTVLIPFFSKYGEENFVTWSTWDEFEGKFGAANPRKYGMDQIFIKGASQYTQSFLGKRLLPDDAAYANSILKYSVAISGEGGIVRSEEEPSVSGVLPTSLTGVTDPSTIEAYGKEMLAFYGSGRGAGYNDIFIKFEPLDEYTRFYADDNGIPYYQFNFLSATIYERQDNGNLVQIEQNKIPFALVDVDPNTGATIKDIYDGMSLNVEDRFETLSNFARAISEDVTSAMTAYLSPYDLHPVLIWDAENGKPAYVIFEDGELTVEYIDGVDGTPTPPPRFVYPDSSGNTKYAILQLSGGKLTLVDDTANGAGSNDLRTMPVFSANAFYDFLVFDTGNFLSSDAQVFQFTAKEGQLFVTAPFSADGAAVIVNDVVLDEDVDYEISGSTIHFTRPLSYGQAVTIISASTNSDPTAVLRQKHFARYDVWKYLIENGIQLTNGSDGEYLYLNNTLNFDGPSETGKQNAKELLVDFYSTNAELREVLYPKYDFDYVPDFTNDPDVQAAIVGLCDYLQTAFGIHSTGIKYDYKQDIEYRKYNLGISSFCNALYSGEANKRHYDSDIGGIIVMPSNYYALLDHLYVDGTMDIAEPVAGINKGTIRTGSIKLTYSPTALEIEKLRMKQINAIIDEPDGIYFIDQLTMYKKASILSRIHAIKPIMQVKKDLRKLLKDVLQSKDGRTAEGRAQTIIDEYMKDKIYDAQKNRKGWFEYYKTEIDFDENKLEIQVLLTIKPLRSVEKVSVTIGVV